MARQNGILNIEGTLENLTFYKTQDGNLVKTKSGVSADRIATDPNFQRTRENGAEFGNSASAGKLLRDALRNMMINASDNRVTSRITQVMTVIKNFDSTSVRGDRNVGVAIATNEAKAQLKNFNFNADAVLSAILHKSYVVDTTTGQISITGLKPMDDVVYPASATNMTIKGAWLKVDFVANTSEIEYTNEVSLPINNTSGDVNLIPAAVPAGSGINLFILAIDFFQEVNGLQYSLKNGGYNTLSIVEVA
jgi:hypothetical protein